MTLRQRLGDIEGKRIDREVDVDTAVPDEWKESTKLRAPSVDLPPTMGDGGDVAYTPWDGPGGTPETGVASVDRALTRIDSAIDHEELEFGMELEVAFSEHAHGEMLPQLRRRGSAQ